MKTLLVGTFFFVMGVFGSDFLIGAYRFLSGSIEVKCLPDSGICVGDDVSKKRLGGHYTFDNIGGLTTIICDTAQGAKADYFFVQDIMGGARCQATSFMLEFRNTTTRTVVEVESGRVVKITRGPLHSIDP